MNSNSLAEFFSKKAGRCRGNTLQERLQGLQKKWAKIASDSLIQIEDGNDTSIYRRSFQMAHLVSSERLNKLIEQVAINEREAPNCRGVSNIIFLFGKEDVDTQGLTDAVGFMTAELNKAFEDV
jgi:hypothetical protein